jgi:hypothetical protein
VIKLIEPHPEEIQEETWDAITEAARQHSDDGKLRMTNLVLIAAGRA